MAINDWWSGDPAERFWMETTDRSDLGVDLNTRQLNKAGRREWGYTLVTETRPGDVIFHWHKSLSGWPALVGWSTVFGPLSVDPDYARTPQVIRGQARGLPAVGQGWRMPCGDFHLLPSPVSGRTMTEREINLRQVYEELKARVRGALYFPFNFYRPGEIRASQSYLTKFPAALLQILPELGDAISGDLSSTFTLSAGQAVSSLVPAAAGRMQDPEIRIALERHALELAKHHYFNLGATQIIERGKPFDLIVLGLGADRHVEVKGSSMLLSGVELTLNEVTHAQNHQPTDLFVVDQIKAQRRSDGPYETSGGRCRVWPDWIPSELGLKPTRFSYSLPGEF